MGTLAVSKKMLSHLFWTPDYTFSLFFFVVVFLFDSHIQRVVLLATEETTVTQQVRHVCVCVFFPFILDIKFVGRTSRGHTGGRSHRISHPPSFCGACLNFSREKDSAIPFPRRP